MKSVHICTLLKYSIIGTSQNFGIDVMYLSHYLQDSLVHK